MTASLPFRAAGTGAAAAAAEEASSAEPTAGAGEQDGKSAVENAETTAPAEKETNKATPADAVPYQPVAGDADGDSKVTSGDARLVLRFSVHLEEIPAVYLVNCDVDEDDRITPSDARLILRWSVGLFIDKRDPYPAKPTKEEYVQQLIDMVDDTEIQSNMKSFTEDIGARWYTSDNFGTAREQIKTILEHNGFAKEDIWEDEFTCNEEQVYSIYTKITTTATDPDIILFVAHYDSYHKGKGSVDNARGLCTVLEISRVLKSLNADLGVEVRFLFTACEELGYYGAYHYVDHYSPLSLDRHVAVFNVDMSAHFTGSKKNYLTVSTKSAYGSDAPSNKPSTAVDEAKKIVGSCGEYKYLSPVAAGLHDLIPFDKKELETITLSWRVINATNSHGSDYNLAAPSQIHTSKDTLGNTDMDSLYKTTRLAVGAAGIMIYDYAVEE